MVFGYLAQDIIVSCESLTSLRDASPASVDWQDGGAAGNVAAWLVAVGAQAEFVGYTGADELGNDLAGRLIAIDLTVQLVQHGRTPRIVSLSHPEGRSLLVDQGGDFGSGPVAESMTAGARIVHVPLFALFRRDLQRRTEELLEEATNPGTGLSIDVCSANGLERFGIERFYRLCARCQPQYVLMNIEEADQLDVKRMCRDLANATLIVHRGRDATHIHQGSELSEIPVATPRYSDIDPTGAGDAFAAGFLQAVAEDRTVQTAVSRAHAVAGVAITMAGARPAASFDLEPLRRALAES